MPFTGYYHVFDRGNSKQIIFEDDSDRYRFLSDISDRFARHDVAVLAWCLMDNHFHLMVDDPYDNLSKAMQCALTAYAKYFNGKTGRTGHLFDNRYSRVAVESDTQAVQLLDYIHLNPVKGAIDFPKHTAGRNFRAYQLGYDPFDICDAAPMLDIVGGSRCYCEHLESCRAHLVNGGSSTPAGSPMRRPFRCARSSAEHRSCTAQSPATPRTRCLPA